MPLAAHPVFDLCAAVEKTTLKVEDRAGQGGCQVGNHSSLVAIAASNCWPESYTAVHKSGVCGRGQPFEKR
ncbi:MAG: hypothetical protein ACD_10C00431G0001 [uncultured bacterium]|nr:MAG: hypothetical protein ACD_10C00431G0001 [uncultured bacterium]